LLLIAGAISGWVLAGCGESRQDALNRLATADRGTRAESAVIDERVAAGAFGHLPCLEAQLKEAAFIRERHSVAPALRYRDEPAVEVSAQKEIDHAADLYGALAHCLPDEASKRLAADLLARLSEKAKRLSDAFGDYLKKTSGPAQDAVRSDVERDDAELK
jgi:hypothetical protein